MQTYQTKTFTHNFFDPSRKPIAEQITYPNGKRVYKYFSDGAEYKSVTTFLSETKSHSIEEWRKAVGEEEANKKVKMATDRGSAFHGHAEKYLYNETPNFADFIEKSNFVSMIDVLNSFDNIRMIEGQIRLNRLKLGGTVDLIAEYKGVLSVIDFKTSSKKKTEDMITNYFIQTLLYSLAIEEMYGVRIDQLVVPIMVEFERPTVFVKKRDNVYNDLLLLLK